MYVPIITSKKIKFPAKIIQKPETSNSKENSLKMTFSMTPEFVERHLIQCVECNEQSVSGI